MTGTRVVGIDPGIAGAILVTNGKSLESHFMPILVTGKDKAVDFHGVHDLMSALQKKYGLAHVFLERAIPFAMGAKAAFSYGRGFEAIVIALKLLQFPTTLVDPGKWTKEMHEGISSDLKPKVKSGIAITRLYPQLVASLPKKPKGGLHDGPIDALLIAGYGLRKLSGTARKPAKAFTPVNDSEDFY